MTERMNNLLKLEEVGQFVLSLILFGQLDFSWWVFPALILLPDLAMIGYLFNPKTGAFLYNLVHHKLLAIALWGLGYWLKVPGLSLAGVILLGHSAIDRTLGYGLKYGESFQSTHLGKIGKNA